MNSRQIVAGNRSAVVFLVGLLAAAGISAALDGAGAWKVKVSGVSEISGKLKETEIAPQRVLSAQDLTAARIAWRYIERNTRPETGLVDSVADFPSTTLWDQGSYLLAVLSARVIGIIDSDEFDHRVDRFIATFEQLPLFEGTLPNKVYHTQTLEMVDYQNNPAPDGIGWSALDVARMLSALRAIERFEPKFGARIRQLLAAWDLDAMTREGQMIGARREDGVTEFLQEGRIGYEQYAARASALWGLDVLGVISIRPFLDWETIAGVEIPVDQRDHSTFHAITPVLSEPFILQGLELGLDSEAALMADRVYRAQEARFKDTGQMTMVSEDHVDQAPYFLYSSVHSNGEPWAVVNEDGKHFEELRTVSLKSAFAWDAIYNTEYTRFLRKELFAIANPEKGWPAGVYEEDGRINEAYTLNTNAIVLEAIHFIAHGPLWNTN